MLEEWTGLKLKPVSCYGIRVYKQGGILSPHVDRDPLVTSAIINVDQVRSVSLWFASHSCNQSRFGSIC